LDKLAIVLAGGKGTRLRPLTYVKPKPLIPIAGKPIIDYIIEWLRYNGFKKFIVLAKYLGEQIKDHFTNTNDVSVEILDSKDTADAVRLISDQIKTENFLVSMGDVLCNARFDTFYEEHSRMGGIATIALKEVDNPLHYGLVFIDSRRRIRLFVEKPLSIEIYALSMAHVRVFGESIYSNYVNTGFYMIRYELLNILQENPALMDWGKHVFPYLLENGYDVYSWIMPHNTYWEDIGRIENYKKATWDVLNGVVKGFKPNGKQIEPGVYVEENTDIRGNIIPPVSIGPDTIIEEGATIGPYVSIGEGVHIGRDAKASYSIVWESTHISSNTDIYDSIIMDHVLIGDSTKIISSIIGSYNNIGSNEVIERKIIPPKIR